MTQFSSIPLPLMVHEAASEYGAKPILADEWGNEMSNAIVIKGCPSDKWDEVQAIHHQPFIYIHHNGSHWAGEEGDDVDVLLDMLANHPLDPERFHAEIDPCAAQDNPEWNYSSGDDVPRWINGPRLYACNGVVRYSGNFSDWSHAFCIETNDPVTINALDTAVVANLDTQRMSAGFSEALALTVKAVAA